MTFILKDIYNDVALAPLLGLKGGTAGMLFYDLPRFSVDLDFDLLDANKASAPEIMQKVEAILLRHGEVKDKFIKYRTIFLLHSYGKGERGIKVEISTRLPDYLQKGHFVTRELLGIGVQVGKPEYLFSTKLAALTTRRELAVRDLFDIEYYCRKHWDISEEIIKHYTNKSVKEYLLDCIKFVEQVENKHILKGLGELLNDEKQKAWVRDNLKNEVLFQLKLRLELEGR